MINLFNPEIGLKIFDREIASRPFVKQKLIDRLIDEINLDGLDKEKFKKLFENKNIVNGDIVANIKGIAMFDKIVIDVNGFKTLEPKVQVFCLLHELCHSLRFDKLGIEFYLSTLANENFDEFAEVVIKEEILADRYASIMFNKLTGLAYDWYDTQRLTNAFYRDQYIQRVVPMLFKKFKNKEEYLNFWNQFYKEK